MLYRYGPDIKLAGYRGFIGYSSLGTGYYLAKPDTVYKIRPDTGDQIAHYPNGSGYW